MYEYNAEVRRVVDGDTVDVTIDCGFNIHIKERVRLSGIDAPENRTRDLEYGRLLGKLHGESHPHSANQMLLEEGHAIEYIG